MGEVQRGQERMAESEGHHPAASVGGEDAGHGPERRPVGSSGAPSVVWWDHTGEGRGWGTLESSPGSGIAGCSFPRMSSHPRTPPLCGSPLSPS